MITIIGQNIYKDGILLDYSSTTTKGGRCALTREGKTVVRDISHAINNPQALDDIITGLEVARFKRGGLGSSRGVRNGRPRTIYLDDATFEGAQIIGDGSASSGIRLAVLKVRGSL